MSTGTPALVRRVDGMTFGRPTHWYVRADTGERIDGVTTILKGFMPTPALIRWASNTTAEAAVDRWDELSAMGVSERLKTLKGAACGVHRRRLDGPRRPAARHVGDRRQEGRIGEVADPGRGVDAAGHAHLRAGVLGPVRGPDGDRGDRVGGCVVRLTVRGWLLILSASFLLGTATANVGLPGWSR